MLRQAFIDEHFYHSLQGQDSFHAEPPGELVVNRILEGKPCWQRAGDGTKKRPKTLIIADWTMESRIPFEKRKIRETMEHLLNTGFRIFIWIDNELKPLTHESLDLLDLSSHNVLPNIENLETMAVEQLGLTKDEVHVIDYHCMDSLLDPDQNPLDRPRAFKFSYPPDILEDKDSLDQLQQSIKEIVYDEFTFNFDEKKIKKLEQIFPSIQRKERYQKVQIQESKQNIVISDKHFMNADFQLTFNKENLQNILDLSIANIQMKSIPIFLLLRVSTHLKTFEIKYGKIEIEMKEITTHESLEDLILRQEVKAEASDLSLVLSCLPNIKRLTLLNNIIFSKKDDIKLSLPNLKSLNAIFFTEEVDNKPYSYLNKIISVSPHIQDVELLVKTDEPLHFSNQLPYLRKIKLSAYDGYDINKTYESLLNACDDSTLDEIHLNGKISGEIKGLEKLKNVKKFTITHVPVGFLTNHFKNMALLESLTIAFKLTQKIEKIPTLMQLSNMTILGEMFSLDDLGRLIGCAPHLKKLTLQTSFKEQQAEYYFDSTALAALRSVEALDLNNGQFSFALIKNLLSAMPNLKEVNISGLKDERGNKYESISIKNCLLEIYKTNLPRIKSYPLKILKNKELQEEKNVLLSDQKHRPDIMRDFKPNQNPFVFKNQNKTFNQNMITEKLSQYLTLTQQHLASIPRLKDGICSALSYLFLEMCVNKKSQQEQWLDLLKSTQIWICNTLCHLLLETCLNKKSPQEKWLEFLKPIQTWNGQAESLTPELKTAFDIIFKKVKQYQFVSYNKKDIYIGDQLKTLLKERKPRVLGNPWHAIVLTPEGSDQWTVYDPNFVNGPKIVSNEEVIPLIKDQIGSLIFLLLSPEEVSSYQITPVIPDVNAFIEQGGLLALTRSDNKQAMLDILLKEKKELKTASFAGLLLRDVTGIPAWVGALDDPLCREYGWHLLSQWIASDQAAMDTLKNSIEHLQPSKKGEIITTLVQLMQDPEKGSKLQGASWIEEKSEIQDEKASSSVMNAFIKTISKSSNKEYYAKQLETWKKEIREETDAKTFAHHTLNAEDTSYLIECTSNIAAKTLPYILHRHGIHSSQPVFHIYSPDDLVCSARWVRRDEKDEKIGSVQEPPGGRLYDFLKEHQGKKPVLIVHYDHFTSSDIVRFNALLDKKPEADGNPLPEDTKVIGIMNVKRRDVYQGSDFYSRFSKVERCPLTLEQITQAAPLLPIDKKCEEKPSSFINLYGNSDWKSQLLGTWKLQGDQLVFAEGKLVSVLKQLSESKSNLLEIRNGPWNDPEFQHFWQQALLEGYVNQAGLKIDIPKDLRFVKVDGYEWKQKEKIATIQQGLLYDEKAIVLNPTTLHSFFEQYHCDNNKHTLQTIPGWIEQQKDKTLVVNLTQTLTDSQWAKLLDHCEKYNVTLQIHAADNLTFPKGWVVPLKEKEEKIPVFLHTRAIIAEDSDAAILSLKQDEQKSESSKGQKEWKVIDISECSISDLMMRLDGSWNQEKKRFHFTETTQALLTFLEKDERVILKGHFSSELANALAPLLLKRASGEKQAGQLVLLTSQPDLFNFLPCEKQKPLTAEDKKNYLIKKGYREMKQLEDSLLEKSSCSELEAYLISKDPWIGMRHLPQEEGSQGFCDFDDSKVIANAFTQERIKLLSDMLALAPYAFITGLTGVGKSTFMQEDYKNYLKGRGKLYQGEANIAAWAKDQREGEKILFIDEANLSKRQWSEFEGLFEDPRGILIQGTYYPLTQQHKVVFAGNPVSYGDERTLAPLFKRHGNAVLFKPLPLEYIYHVILEPLFTNSGIDKVKQLAICNVFFKTYQTVLSFSKKEVLMSPRELQTMAALTIAHAKTYPDEAILAAKHYAYLLAKSVTPVSQQSRLIPPEVQLTQEKKEEKSDYLITPSRKPVCDILDDLFKLRAVRLAKHRELRLAKKENGIWDSFLYGGLGGVVLEGVSAAGKSEMLIAQLRAAGFEEKRLDPSDLKKKSDEKEALEVKEDPEEKEETFDVEEKDLADIKDNIFYKMPVSMSVTEKEALLCKAFKEGAIVIVDEINSSSMMERVLNEMLMGKYQGKRPTRPGFMILGTQNPVTLAGRRKASTALSRRMMTFTLPPYSTDEIKAILVHKGIPDTRAKELADVFDVQLKKAEQEQLKPAPTLRDLLRLANNVIDLEKNVNTVLSKNDPEFEKSGKDDIPYKVIESDENILIDLDKGPIELKSLPESKEFDLLSSIYDQFLKLESSDIKTAKKLRDQLLELLSQSQFKNTSTLFQSSFLHKTTSLLKQLDLFLERDIPFHEKNRLVA